MKTNKGKYFAALERYARKRPPHSQVLCLGGPFHGQTLYMDTTHDGVTAVFTCGAWQGRYACGRGLSHKKNVDFHGNRRRQLTALEGPAVWHSV